MNLATHDRMPPEAAWAEAENSADADVRWPTDRAPLCGATGSAPAPSMQLVAAVTRLSGGRVFGPFDLQIASGERLAIVGPSGAGKSTLLKLLAGDLAPSAGRVQVDGRPLVAHSRAALALRRAVLPQSHGVAFGMPVALVVGLGRMARVVDPALATVTAEALAAAQAAHLSHRRFDTLSGGEQARVMLARVFAQLWDTAPGFLLVDEPLSALDPGLQLELTDALLGFCSARSHALVAVLHDLNLALADFDRLWLVQHGQLAADLATDRAAVPALERLFGIGLQCVEDGHGRFGVLPRRSERRSAATDALAVATGIA